VPPFFSGNRTPSYSLPSPWIRWSSRVRRCLFSIDVAVAAAQLKTRFLSTGPSLFPCMISPQVAAVLSPNVVESWRFGRGGLFFLVPSHLDLEGETTPPRGPRDDHLVSLSRPPRTYSFIKHRKVALILPFDRDNFEQENESPACSLVLSLTNFDELSRSCLLSLIHFGRRSVLTSLNDLPFSLAD